MQDIRQELLEKVKKSRMPDRVKRTWKRNIRNVRGREEQVQEYLETLRDKLDHG